MKEVRHKGSIQNGSIHKTFEKDKSIRVVFRPVAARDQERQEGVVWEEEQRQLSAVMEPLYLDYKGAHTTIHNCQNSDCTLERVHFIRGNISKNLTFKKKRKIINKVISYKIDGMKKVPCA